MVTSVTRIGHLVAPAGVLGVLIVLIPGMGRGETPEDEGGIDSRVVTASTDFQGTRENGLNLFAPQFLPARVSTNVLRDHPDTTRPRFPHPPPMEAIGEARAHQRDQEPDCRVGMMAREPDERLRQVRLDLDRRIAQFELVVKALRERWTKGLGGGRPAQSASPAPSPPVFMAGFPGSHSENRPSQGPQEDAEENAEEIGLLEEVVVEDEFLDPFDGSTTGGTNDPWEGFNAHVFQVNVMLDHFVLRPLATGYDWIVPDLVEEGIHNAIQNIRFVPRFANNLFQGKFKNSGVEVGRFLINSTLGLAGLVDMADLAFGLNVPPEDMGQTLGAYAVPSGPYLVLPLLPPMSVRDGMGTLADMVLDPLSYILPFMAQAGLRGGDLMNERSRHLDLFEGVQVGTLDLYGAVRSAYFQRRDRAIRE